MEYLILVLAFLAVGAFVFCRGLWDARRQEVWQRKKMEENFGTRTARKYEEGEFEGIGGYLKKHQEKFLIDDITWNDLNMDEIFVQMNSTCSSAGQEYLYYMLRTPSFDEKELARRTELMDYFASHPKERLDIQMLYRKMGRTGKYSIYDYLDFLDVLGERKNGRILLVDILLILSVALIAVSPQAGVISFGALLIFHITTYMKEKEKVEPYLVSFRYIFRTLTLAEGLGRHQESELQPELERIRSLLPAFKKLKKNASLGMQSLGGGGPMEMCMAYLNMMFHLDILCFNRMLRAVRERTDEIDLLLTIVGKLEAMIAAAGFRRSLDGYCQPVLDSQTLEIKGVYHPLLTNPVKNDISTCRGVLLTGSNASGKSTFLKAVAINAILAQTIHTCYAQEYRGSFCRVMSSMSLRDDLCGGESYYIVEIKSLKRILEAVDAPGAPVLCFVDEVLRGTNTVERIAASSQILLSLHRPGVRCFAATHDIELTELLKKDYDNYHFEEEIIENDIRFPYRLMSGKAKTRNAIRLLSIMGYEESIIRRAEELAAQFLEKKSWG